MEKYLGEKVIKIKDSPFKNYTTIDWIEYYVAQYGQIDGDHHKAWLLDQIARIFNGTKVIIKLARWQNGIIGQSEYRISLGKPSKKYEKWVQAMRGEFNEYSYDPGIAP